MASLLSFLNTHREAILADLELLVRAESPSNQKLAVDHCGTVLQHLFEERLGAAATLLHQDQAGDHLRFCLGASDRQILILGHFDTVWDIGKLEYRVEKNQAFGPGIFDMKAGIIQALWAVRAIRELACPLRWNIVFLLTTDEEAGSATSRPMIEAEARKSEAVLVVEPPVAGSNALKTARKGVGHFSIRIKGKAAHAGNNPEEGISAVQEMAHQILFFDSLANPSLGTTVNVGRAQGGTRSNVVAAEAELQVDLRVTTMKEADRIKSAIERITPVLKGALITSEGEMVRPPMERSEAIGKLFRLAQECGTILGLSLTEASVGGGSDGNFTAALGVPTLDGLGAIGRGLHAEDEQIVIDQVPVRAALLGELILRIDENISSPAETLSKSFQ
jgi:glutamate carboxypeptidase